MKKKIPVALLFTSLFLFSILSCGKTSEEEVQLEKLLNAWSEVYVFYTNQTETIGKLGFLNPKTVSLIHQSLITNEEFNQKAVKYFNSVNEYIQAFSNVVIHYTYFSFSNVIGTNVSSEKIDKMEKLIKEGALKSNPNRDKIILLYTRLKEYTSLSTNVSKGWLDVVKKHETDIINMFMPLTSK
jgi:hypothetical protein